MIRRCTSSSDTDGGQIVGFKIEIDGAPPRKNDRHFLTKKSGRPVQVNSPSYRKLVEAIRTSWTAATIDSGIWVVEIIAWWPRRRDLGDVKVPFGDIDAPVSSVLDALEAAGVVDNDMRFAGMVASRRYDAGREGLVITGTRS